VWLAWRWDDGWVRSLLIRACASLVTAVAAVALPAGASARSFAVRDGRVRFEILTPSLIRMEYAQDRRFENAPTLTATRSRLPVPRFSTETRGGWLVIRTRRVILRYRLGSGPFGAANLRLTLKRGGRRVTVAPAAGSTAGNLGGWTRALDNQAGPVPLHPGVLSKVGWYVINDTDTVLLPGGSSFRVRSPHVGPYEDWYLLGYGLDYAEGLRDLRALAGPAPLLPRKAFGVWFSRYYPYSPSDYHGLLARFRAHRVPLDTLSIDTDWKHENNRAGAAVAARVAGAPGRPYSWNGWEWDRTLFPDPKQFISWAHAHGLSLTLNIHPTIDTNDPRYPAATAQAGPLTPDNGQCRILEADPHGHCMTFDWNSSRQLNAYFTLHAPFERQGIDFFWLDWCCDGPQSSVPGLAEDTWINSRYYAEQRTRGSRWPAFSRIGGAFAESGADGPDNDRAQGDRGDGALADHRYTIQFTGDTCATWSMLAFEARLSAEEGNIGLPYVSHDIGSYNGVPGNLPCGDSDYQVTPAAIASRQLPDDLYARWVQFGTFQPLDRLHSNHGNRLPWEYGRAADASATKFLELREALNPYIYTLARRAYDTGLPITGALYLQWPRIAGAYQHPSQYTFGRDMVVAPVASSGDPASVNVWIPPGSWIDFFTGRRFKGPRLRRLLVPLARMPVLVRAGAIVPTQPYGPSTAPGSPKALTITAFPGVSGSFRLYDDQGLGFGYRRGLFAWTAISQVRHGRRTKLTIGALRGSFPGAPRARSWTARLLGVTRPHVVRVDGRITRAWRYATATRALTIKTGRRTSHRPLSIVAQ
jgi:Glycosyl hydrolases family 31/Domain of unknown function (DUF5110)